MNKTLHPDHREYYHFTTKSRLDKSINSLLGLIEGVAIDRTINEKELAFLNAWLSEHQELRNRHPYNELIKVIEDSIADGVLTKEEQEDITWLCQKMQSNEFYDQITSDIQRLHAIVGGIASDGHISEQELMGLANWLEEHTHLKTCWPYDEIDSLITSVMQDKKIDDKEQKLLQEFFTEFVSILDNKTLTSPVVTENGNVIGLCAVCPEIQFEGSKFCFTGASLVYTRQTLQSTVERLGGEISTSVTKKTQYLVIGAEGNPCWSYACYGRKVEKAVELRKQGARIQIVHENDFHDAVEEAR